MTSRVRKAVIPAAGLGTRFLPATKAQPKEMLPVVDKPAIQYVVEEAVAAGLTDILVVTGRNKQAIEDHFDRMPELEHELRAGGKDEALAGVQALADLADVHFVRQGQPLGLGHAVATARRHVGDEPFAVLLPDDLMVDDAALLTGMVEAASRHSASVIAFREVPRAEIAAYGVARPAPEPAEGNLVRLAGMVEKPAPEDAPSTLAATGRYVFTPDIFDALDRVEPGAGGELQLTDGIALLLADRPVYGFVFERGRFDVGKPVDHFRATVELAAARPDLGPDVRAFLADFVRREGDRLMALVPLADAQARVLDACQPFHPSAVPLADALGCVTSLALRAEEAVPPFANTAMDGYAVRAADTTAAPVTLTVVGTLAAGDAAGVAVGPGEAIRIMTGAPMPPGADAVVMVERTRAAADGARVEVEVAVAPGTSVREAGDDVRPGDEVVPAGTVLGPGHLGVLASLGMRRVPVYRRARVGVLSTGDELVDGSGPLRPGQIRDSNRPTLLALLRQAGCEPVDLGLAPDDEDAIVAAVEQGASTCDALLTSGGVSVGDFDYVKAVLDRLGDMTWMQVAIRPAKPFAFGTVGAVPVFGLPGNPVSSMVSFELFARPALRRMMGHRQLERRSVLAAAEHDLRRTPDGKTHFVRVVATTADDGRVQVRSAGGQGSHQLTAMAAANGLAVLPDGTGVAAGDEVRTLLLA